MHLITATTEEQKTYLLQPDPNSIPLRIGLLMDHPSPHMVAFLDALAARDDCVVSVIYCGDSPLWRKWGSPVGKVPHHFLRRISARQGFRFNPRIIPAMNRVRADVWIVNTVYTSLSTLAAAHWLHAGGKPWAYMNEPVRPRAKALSFFENFLLNCVIRRARGVIGTGKRAIELYSPFVHEGQLAESIPYYEDLCDFFQLPLPTVASEKANVHFFTSCRMIERKGVDVLLDACKLLPETGWRLTLAGDGALRNKLETKFARRWPAGKVRFIGEIPYQHRTATFVGKHVFVLPSRWDGWGMVVPEALAAGIPVIATERVIAAHEFISEGKNGFVLPADNARALADKMLWFIQNPSLIPRMGMEARSSVKEYQAAEGAERFVRYCEKLAAGAGRESASNCGSNSPSTLTWAALGNSDGLSKTFARKMSQMAKKSTIHASLIARPHLKAKGHTILAYHLVLGEDKKRFEDHLRFAADHFRIGSLTELLQSAKLESRDEFRLAITFDDGFHILMNECLELLEKHKVKASFYVPAAFIEAGSRPEAAVEFSRRAFYFGMALKPMDPEDLKRLAILGHEVGSHGMSHTALSSLTKEQAERELRISKLKIAKWTGREPAGFAYPYSETANSLGNPAEWLRESGYEYGLTFTRGTVNETSNPLMLPRHHAEGSWSVRELQYFLLT